MSGVPSKPCASCGRTITWRKKWARLWDDVRYCSDACRRRGVTDVDRRLEDTTRALLGSRRGAVSPADVARAVGDEASWRELLEPARRAARRLVAAGEVDIVQGGRVVDPSHAKGPFEIRRRA